MVSISSPLTPTAPFRRSNQASRDQLLHSPLAQFFGLLGMDPPLDILFYSKRRENLSQYINQIKTIEIRESPGKSSKHQLGYATNR